MLMLVGWRIFKYSRRALGDGLSYCGVDIAQHFQSVFTHECKGPLSIYTTAAKTIEVFVGEGIAEARLLLWSERGTACIILEKVCADKSDCRAYGREVEMVFSERCFVLSFYKEDEAAHFVSMCHLGPDSSVACGGATAFINQMRQLNRNTDKQRSEKQVPVWRTL